jgi:hypothetical protein
MKRQLSISTPILALGAAVLAVFLWLGVWRGLRAKTLSPESLAEPRAAEPALESGSVSPLSNATDRIADGLPPVVPLSLAGVLVQAENDLAQIDTALLSLPRGTQSFGGIEFRMEGLVHLQGTASEQEQRKNFRRQVVVPLSRANAGNGSQVIVPLGSNVACLHLLGGTRYTAEPGTRFADVVWRYTDGAVRRSPLQYAVHLRDWWRKRYEEPVQLPFPFTKVAWRIPHPSRTDRTLRLYRLTLTNPEPAKVIRQLEFSSAMTRPSLFFLALTLDPLKPGERPDDLWGLEETDPELTGRMQLFVQDATGLPVARASVRVATTESASRMESFNRTAETDPGGMVIVSFPTEKLATLEVRASHDDHGARKMIWDTRAGDVIPASYTLRLGNGINIGGIIVDEGDRPIADARISLYRFWSGGEHMDRKGEAADFPNQTRISDAQGRWQARGLPAELLHRILFEVRHTDYPGTNYTVGEGERIEQELRAGTFKTVLRGGLEVHGIVTDQADNPVAEATVWAGRGHTRERQEQQTDAQGKFSFRNINAGNVLFSVIAKRLKPAVNDVYVKPGMDDIVFRLGQGNVIRARVQNEAAEPLPGARLALESPNGAVPETYEFEGTTDSDGRFEWDGAPDEPASFYVYKVGYEQKRQQRLEPNKDNLVTLRKCRRVQGRVLDAATEQPVTRFRVGVGRYEGPDLPFFTDWPGMKGFSDANGTFSLELEEEEHSGIKAEADDYAEQVRKLPEARDGVVEVVLRLESSAAVRAVLVTPEGAPVPGATVALTSSSGGPGSQRATLIRGRLAASGSESKIVTTDAAGQFTLPSPLESGGLVVAACESGFASAPVQQVRDSGRLVLQPYGRIEGTFKIGGQPAAGQEFLLSMMNSGIRVDWSGYKTQTDEQGRFSFSKVPPGPAQVVRLIKTSSGAWMHSHSTEVMVEPGKTLQLNLGDSGAIIQGRARLQTPPENGEQITLGGSLNTSLPPAPAAFNSPEEARAFFSSPEWAALRKTQKYFGVVVNPDGSFVVDSIPAGTYGLQINAAKPKPGGQPWETIPVASGQTLVTVPDTPNPQVPISVGEIILTPVKITDGPPRSP